MRQKYTKGLKSMTTLMTPDERRALFDRIAQIMLKQYPADRKLRPNARDDALLDEQYYATLAEYADRLPRIVVGRCPFSGQLLKRAVDVYDLSGPWWKPNKPFRPQEPPTPSTFLVLLGSLDMHGRVPNEAKESSILAGPAVPFVVPAMLNMKGVKAVITSFTLMTGDTAYVISYWSERVIDGSYLHQPWLETMLWFPNGNGGKSWMTSNDKWDHNLEPWIRAGKLLWINPDDADAKLCDGSQGATCPFVGLPGERRPQYIVDGEVILQDLPDGSLVIPFEE
jgi:hypothetical protein